MSNPILTAAILIEANGAALNNAGNDAGQRLDNAVVVKQIKVGKNRYPYISGQAVRRWWREVLYEDFGWAPSPVTREAKSAYTEGNPIQYPDDDVFGYMAAKKAKKAQKPKKSEAAAASTPITGEETESSSTEPEEAGSGGTQRRVSPLKNSLLVSVVPDVITSDFGHFSRDLPVGNPNMVPFEHEHYTALMQGVFTLSLQDVGHFECGLMRDLALDAAAPEGVELAQEAQGNLQPRVLRMPREERKKRVVDTLKALGRLRHGANLTRNLSDVAPVVTLFGCLDGGNAPFQNLFTGTEKGVTLNLPRLESVLKDYKDRLLGDGKLYFGYRPGVLANEEELTTALRAGIAGVTVFVGTPGQAIAEVTKLFDKDGLL
jgi:CRISPR-associated protein Cst2